MDLRDYDPAIARWTGVDPVTHFSQSPYNAFDGNPVLIADPSGADGVVPNPTGTIYGMAGQSVAANYGGPIGGHIGVWMGAHSENEMSYSGHLARQATEFHRSFIGAFIAGSLRQIVNAGESFQSMLKIFSASQDTEAFNYLISSSDDGYGNFIEMAALVTENSTFVFSDSRNDTITSFIDFTYYKGRGTINGNQTFFDGQRILAQVHTHNEFSKIESSGDFETSMKLRVPVYAIDIATQMIGRGFDFTKIEGVKGNRYESTGNISSIQALLNGNFNIRNDANKILQQTGF
jgi:hypothetical protein